MNDILEIVDLLRDREKRVRGLDFDPQQAHLTEDQLVLRGEPFPLLPTGRNQLLDSLGIPVGYYDRIPPDLQELTVNRLMPTGSGLAGKRLYLLDGQVIGFARATLAYVPGVAVLREIHEVVNGQPVGVEAFRLDPWGFQLNLIFPGKFVEPEVGDVTQGGLRLVHSDLGLHPTLLAGYMKRLRCLNGLELPERGPTHRLDSPSLRATRDGFLLHLQSLTRKIWSGLSSHLQGFAGLRDVKVDDVLEWTRRMLLQARLGRLQDRVARALRLEPDLGSNMYAVVNALSRVSTHDTSLSERERRGLVRTAGQSFDVNVCRHCQQPLTFSTRNASCGQGSPS